MYQSVVHDANSRPELDVSEHETGRQCCRVCLEEDNSEKLARPCSCSGSMQYVHQDCLQLWINEKGSKLCEICKQPYQGSYSDPPARTPVHAPNSALLAHLRRHGVVLRAVPVTDVNSLQQQDEAQDTEEAEESRQSGIAWCFGAILAFMAMLLIRHIFELVDSSAARHGPPQGPPGHDPHHSDPFAPEGNASAGMLVMWLTMRFLVILIPMYAVLRVMHTMRHQQVQQDVDRQLEQEMMTLLWSMEAGILTDQHPAVRRQADRLSPHPQTDIRQLPIIV